MKPPPFDYVRPRDLDETLRMMAELEDATLLAGGQSLVPMLNMRLARPAVVIDINHLDGLAGVRWSDNRVEIGAMTRHHELESDHRLANEFPALTDAVTKIGYQAIRHRGTLGGSLAHADPAAELPTIMTALGAEIVLTSSSGTRTVPADTFFTGYYSTERHPTEMITAVTIATGGRSGFLEFSRRAGDFAIALAAVGYRDGGVRAVVGGLDTRPRRITPFEKRLGSRDDRVDNDEIADITIPMGDIHGSPEYRVRLAGELLRRVVSNLGIPA